MKFPYGREFAEITIVQQALADAIQAVDKATGRLRTDVNALAEALRALEPLDVRKRVDAIYEMAGQAREDIDTLSTKYAADIGYLRARIEDVEKKWFAERPTRKTRSPRAAANRRK